MKKGKFSKKQLLIYLSVALFLAILLFGLFMLTNKAHRKVPLGVPFELKAGEEAFIEEKGILLKFVKVTSDSRCPKGVQCVWAGKVSIFIEISKGNMKDLFELSLEPGNENSSKKAFEGLEIKLLEVKPYPEAGKEVGDSDYSASFIVSKIK
ncbi:MAG: hypothetical protein QW400_04420 [Candidatus Diapherotrites archaeon]